ncbi:reductase AKOR2 [Fomitiporia mediterranea MF3/22]|uniref:reductase AKOR2 n=1 Tax=Fomitiporia mediterranea (strain MF3/22) TaxID=694068 RepID=UPI00044089B9|nr:reductase AKOR2 [Fomitiporia mediterranea MF3/22]EJC98072.1 reductase AKOR2 [Fomitiporia mediterranea MF3/22]
MSAPPQTYVTLNNGVKMPAIGLGCWSGLTDEQHEAARPWILSALKVGYRHLDTAHDYGTEGAVGKAVRESGIPREEIHVTTKLPLHHHARVADSIEQSLTNAGFDYYDLWLMHWPQAMANIDDKPNPRYPGPNGEPDNGDFIMDDKTSFNQTWTDMEKIYQSGKVKAIGVSNFSVKNLKKLLQTAKIIPAVNQVEMHPHQTQPELLEFCREKGIILTAYRPTGFPKVADDPTMIKLAENYKVSPTQINLAWDLARGTTAIPKSTNEGRQRANLLELPTLSKEDIELINSLNKNEHYCGYPEPRERNGEKLVFGWTYTQMGW